MVSIPTELESLFSGRISETSSEYVIEVPKSEVESGVLQTGEDYRVGLFSRIASSQSSGDNQSSSASESVVSDSQDPGAIQHRAHNSRQTKPDTSQKNRSYSSTVTPPVSEGELIEVEIESIGNEGDGIAKVDDGYVIFVPKTSEGDTVLIRIKTVKENVAFATAVKNL